MPYASIDAGSNTFRMLVGTFQCNGLSRLYLDRAVTRLAEGISETGRLREENIKKSLSVLKDFSHSIKRYGVTHVKAVGTSALREAENSKEFIEMVFQETGIPIEIISGEEEAELTAKGVMLGLKKVTAVKCVEPLLIIDIGGGSTEWIIHGRDEGHPKKSETFWGPRSCHGSISAGVVNLCERFMKTDPPSHDDISALNREIDLSLGNSAIVRQSDSSVYSVYSVCCVQPDNSINSINSINPINPYLAQSHGRTVALIGTGGTITTLAAIDLGLEGYNPERIHGHTLSLARLYNLRDRLTSLPFKERQAILGLEPERADLIIPGILLTIRIMEVSGLSEIMVSDYGLLEGIMITMMAGR